MIGFGVGVGFETGDRVLVDGTIDDQYFDNRTATILDVIFGEDGRIRRIALEFDIEFIGGHTCSGRGKDGHCWYAGALQADLNCIQLLETEDCVEYPESEELSSFLSEYSVLGGLK